MTAQTNQFPFKTGEDYLRDFTEVCRAIASSNPEEVEKLEAAVAYGRSQEGGRTDQLVIAGETFVKNTGCPGARKLMQGFLARVEAGLNEVLTHLREKDEADDW